MHLGLGIVLGSLFCLGIIQNAKAATNNDGAASKSVLIIYENSRLLPATIEADRGFSEVVATSGLHVEINAEFLGYPQFGGPSYNQAIVPYLHAKYQSRKPGVVVVAGSEALGFWLDHRGDILPDVPVVYFAVVEDTIRKLTLPTDATGVPVRYDIEATLDLAFRLHPHADKLVVITGASDFDGNWKSLSADSAKLSERVRDIEFWSGLPTDALLSRVKALGRNAIIFTPGYFLDGAGRTFAPRDAAKLIAEASPVPVYGPFDTFVGTGVVGGRVPTFRDMGAVAATTAIQLLRGKSPADLHLPETMPLRTSLDWRQIQYWGVDPALVPSDALIQFKTPGPWEQYRSFVIAALAVIALQSVLLLGLIVERRKRRGVEVVVDKHRFDLAHATRLAVAGQLTASIAHEINQPLGAIHSNIAAIGLILQSGGAAHEITPILDDIRRDNIRASEVIRQLRSLIEKHEIERKPVDLVQASADAAAVLHGEARRREVDIDVSIPPASLVVIGDRVQFQQILINLMMNAMDAVASNPVGQRLVSLSLAPQGAAALVTVSDNGHGIEPGKVDLVFDSFVSTKQNGIGLGLSIVRTLVEAHDGRVWGANRATSGASFFVELPLSRKLKSGEAA